MQNYEKKKHTNLKIIMFIVIFVSFILVFVFGYLYILDIKSRPLIDYPQYSLSTYDWTGENIIITVSENDKISAYSFDGGNNFQESNIYEVLENGEYIITVKDINGRLSKMIPIRINKIDKEPPQINFESPTTVQLNSNFSLRNGVIVTDGNGSGLNNNYVVSPDRIDTSVEGTYTIIYTAFDKVGNYTEKSRTIVVTDIVGKTYYRYRTSTVENYQCEPYACNCVVTPSAIETKTCPTGYNFGEPNKCCQECYKTCKRTVWGEWSEWTQERVTPSANTEVETKVE